MSSAQGFVGNTGDNNAVTVTDAGSVWNIQGDLSVGFQGAANQMAILNGGVVTDSSGAVGVFSSNNVVLVSGLGSTWNNQSSLFVGEATGGKSVTVTNSGELFSGSVAFIGYTSTCTNNVVTVTGNGSVWRSGDIYVGVDGASNVLDIIADGGSVFVNSNIRISAATGSSANQVNIQGGNLYVTNTGQNALVCYW